MIREVYINDQLIDIEADNVAGYIFSSPIFRDISKIMSNRTTTYKIPKTTKNLSIFGLANNPDVNALAPYRKHKFLEIRDGLPFINGVCYFLKSTEKELELAVFWGNSEKLQELKDLNLRELEIKDEYVEGNRPIEYFRWNEERKFLSNTSTNDAGYLKIDYGKGLEDMKYIHPAVNIKYILDVIKCSTGITITYEDRFVEEFKKKWFPLTSKNANHITYDEPGKYKVNGFVYLGTNVSNSNYHPLGVDTAGVENNEIIVGDFRKSSIKPKKNSIAGIASGKVVFKSKDKVDNPSSQAECRIYFNWDYKTYAERIVKCKIIDGYYVFEFNFNENPLLAEVEDEDILLQLRAGVRDKSSDQWRSMHGYTVITLPDSDKPTFVVNPNELQFGDKYPLIPNLPDLSVIDFLKSLMSMYGLFTYQDIKANPDVIEFTSINQMYDRKEHTINVTNKLLALNSDTRMKVEYTYGDYARKNYLRYKNDKDIITNADEYAIVDNEQLEKEKDLIELPYSPSVTIGDENNNQYALIPIYDNEGNYSDVGARILERVRYVKENTNNATIKEYMSAYFSDNLYFSGEKGLLNTYYSKYQAVIYHPIVVECAVYFTDLDLHQFREIDPIYIDGVYYMPITITVQTNGVANCKLIKMPFIEK